MGEVRTKAVATTGTKVTPYQAKQAIDKLRSEVATLTRVVANQNEATAKDRREWEMFAQSIDRRTTPDGIDAAEMLTWLSTG